MKEHGLTVGLLVIAAGAFGLAFLSESSSSPVPSAGPSAFESADRRAPRKAPPSRAPAGPSELALVSPLGVGAELADWEVRFIGAVEEGRLAIVLVHEERTMRLEVMLASEDAPEPAAATRRFHVYYRSRGAHPDDGSRLSRALAQVLARNGNVEPPAGMTTYQDPGRDPWSEGI